MKLKINGWEQDLKFSACHFIPHHEKCGRLHGHSYGIHLEIDGGLDREDVIIDFSVIKNHVRELISHLDHRVIIPTKNSSISVIEDGGSVEIYVGGKRYLFPKEDVCLLGTTSSSAEMIATHLGEKTMKLLIGYENVKSFSLGVDEGPGQGAWYRKRMR